MAVRSERVGFALFAVGLPLGLVTPRVLLALTALLATFGVRFFHQSKLVRAMLRGLLIFQAVILLAWTECWTATSVFKKASLEPGWPVIDPQLESALMSAFWMIAAFVVALTVEHLLNFRFLLNPRSAKESSFRKQALILVCELLLLLALNSSVVNFGRFSRDVKIAASVSADGSKEARLVPLNAWIDVNGVLIARRPRSIIWRTIGAIGDSLTEADGGRFVWSNDGSKVYLLLNYYQEKDSPALGFDFETNTAIDPKSYAAQK
ncbi:MAG: hypothetical protein QOF02_787 [Blastocatellia bacterium]|nr:hypothetical protein [Blastocatellia bacterium]